MSANRGLLDIARSTIGQAFAFNGFFNNAFDDFFDNALGSCGGALGGRFFNGVIKFVEVRIAKHRRVKRLRQFRPIAVKRNGFQAEAVSFFINARAFINGGETGRCSAARCGASSRVIAPEQCTLAASISSALKPSSGSRSEP